MSLLRHFDRRPRSPRTLKWVTWPVAAALVAAFPVATWWVVGDLSTVPASARPDFAFRPFTFSHGIILAAGIGSVSLTVLTLTWLTWATVGRRFDARWWTVIVPLLAAGF